MVLEMTAGQLINLTVAATAVVGFGWLWRTAFKVRDRRRYRNIAGEDSIERHSHDRGEEL